MRIVCTLQCNWIDMHEQTNWIGEIHTHTHTHTRIRIYLQIAIVIYLLYLKLGISAVIGAIVCIVIMTPLQFLIGNAMSKNADVIAVSKKMLFCCLYLDHSVIGIEFNYIENNVQISFQYYMKFITFCANIKWPEWSVVHWPIWLPVCLLFWRFTVENLFWGLLFQTLSKLLLVLLLYLLLLTAH